MENPKDGNPGFLDRTSRATRGKRMNKLLDEEVEEDEAFWNQDALKEEENDDEYEEEQEVADEFDSDFNEDESDPDDKDENDADDREKRPKKRLTYPGKPVLKKKKKKKDLSKLEEPRKDGKKDNLSKLDETQSEEKLSEQPTTPDRVKAMDEVEEERSVRKSTRTAVIVRQAERDAIRAALQATMKPIKRKKEGEEKRMTQEEMLLEAAQTEIMNLRNLERVLAREEEVKKRAIVHKQVYSGPLTRYSSKDGHSFIEFLNGMSFDSEISTKSVPYPPKALCVITGLPAKYRDPKTGLPYATKEAFQVIHQRYLDENRCGKGNIAMGSLYDSIIGQGFSSRKKRSLIPHQNQTSNTPYARRFGRIPVVDNLVSD